MPAGSRATSTTGMPADNAPRHAGRHRPMVDLRRVCTLRGIARESAVRMAQRNHWRRRRNNRGEALVMVPIDAMPADSAGGHRPGAPRGGPTVPRTPPTAGSRWSSPPLALRPRRHAPRPSRSARPMRPGRAGDSGHGSGRRGGGSREVPGKFPRYPQPGDGNNIDPSDTLMICGDCISIKI